jgi:pimeloyl-ACP methyl ester carboxylesterase
VLGHDVYETQAQDVLAWPHGRVEVVEVAGCDHLLPLRHPAAVLDAIRAAFAGRS